MTSEAESGSQTHSAGLMPVRDIELPFWEGGARPPPSNDQIIDVHKERPFVSRMETVLDQISHAEWLK